MSTPASFAVRLTPTAPVAAGTLIAGYAVAAGSGSRPLGGVVLLAGGLRCVRAWTRRNGQRTALALACVGLAAFVLSHVLARAIGAWPAVLLVAAVTGAAAWVFADTVSQLSAFVRGAPQPVRNRAASSEPPVASPSL